MDIKDELRAACRRRKVTFADIAAAIDRDPSAISRWFDAGRKIPAEHVLTIERLTGVGRESLRPDIYPPVKRNGANAND